MQQFNEEKIHLKIFIEFSLLHIMKYESFWQKKETEKYQSHYPFHLTVEDEILLNNACHRQSPIQLPTDKPIAFFSFSHNGAN